MQLFQGQVHTLTMSSCSLAQPEQNYFSSVQFGDVRCSLGHLTWCTHIVRKIWDSHQSAPRWSSQSPHPHPAAHVSSPPLAPPPLPAHLAPWSSLRLDGIRVKRPESPVLERRPKRATPGTLARRATEATWVRRGTVESEEETGEAH